MIEGIHHFGLTVRDVDASATWYVDVLRFRRVGEFESPDGARRKVFLRHDGLRARLGLTQHTAGSQDDFDETRVGLGPHRVRRPRPRATRCLGGSPGGCGSGPFTGGAGELDPWCRSAGAARSGQHPARVVR